jgi:TPR repeat protein
VKSALPSSVFALTLLLNGCATPVIEGAQEGYDGVRRDSLTDRAKSGKPADEFALGNTYCCQGAGPLHDASIYDNVKATEWYCKAARQDYAPAQLRLARLYSGHAIRGLHLVLRASDLMGTDDTNLGVALMWATLAARGGEEDGVELRDALKLHVTDEERARAETLLKDWRAAPCRWNEVITPAAKTTAN